MSADARTTLRQMLERFVRGEDQSLRFANEIEGLVLSQFREAEFFEELSYDLATYRPGGGDYLTDEKELARKFRYFLAGPLADSAGGPPR